MEILENEKVGEVFVTGINTDYCGFATARDSQSRGRFFTFVVEDAVSSCSGRRGHEEGLKRTENHLGLDSLVKTRDLLDKTGSEGTESKGKKAMMKEGKYGQMLEKIKDFLLFCK